MFAMAAGRMPPIRRCPDACVIVLLAGSLARYRLAPHCWDGEEERNLALAALSGLDDPEAALRKLSDKANELVSQHWHQIAGAVAA